MQVRRIGWPLGRLTIQRRVSSRSGIHVPVQSLVAVTGRQAADLLLPEHEVCPVGLIVWLAASRVRLLDKFKMR